MSEDILDELVPDPKNKKKQKLSSNAVESIKVVIIFIFIFILNIIFWFETHGSFTLLDGIIFSSIILILVCIFGAFFRVVCWILGGFIKLTTRKPNILSEMGLLDATLIITIITLTSWGLAIIYD